MPENKITIFVVDDDPPVRKGLSRLLRSAGYEVESFASAMDFLARDRYDGIGCIVLDVLMPQLNGLELQEKLSQAEYALPIIFITGHGDVPVSVQAMKKGAVDFLTKPVDGEELLLAIERALEKNEAERKQFLDAIDTNIRLSKLSPRELEVLRYVITGALNKQIAGKLNISEKTVKAHRGQITKKMGVYSVAELVRLAEKAGLRPADMDQ